MSDSTRPTRLRQYPDGPLLVDGHVEVTDENGAVHTSHRPVTAVCRCGASARAPWCDGTHKLLAARKP